MVRVEACCLRDRLKTWYEAEGRNARIRIVLPRGGYAALFHDPAAASAPQARTRACPAHHGRSAVRQPECRSRERLPVRRPPHSLTKVRELRVVAWNSAARQKGRAIIWKLLPRATGRRNHLPVSIRCSGDRLRITPQLIESASGYYLWSDPGDASASDAFAIEEEIAHPIVNTLRGASFGPNLPRA